MIILICCQTPCWVEGEGVSEMSVPRCRGRAMVGGGTQQPTPAGVAAGLAPKHRVEGTELELNHRRAAPTHCPQGLACIPHPCRRQ